MDGKFDLRAWTKVRHQLAWEKLLQLRLGVRSKVRFTWVSGFRDSLILAGMIGLPQASMGVDLRHRLETS